jgi:DNA repair protein RadA/Sms
MGKTREYIEVVRQPPEPSRPCPACSSGIPLSKYKCPSCGLWCLSNESNGDRFHSPSSSFGSLRTTPLSSVTPSSHSRRTVGDCDPAFGGGVVSTSVNLLAGDAGSGKSTISLEWLDKLLESYGRATYIYLEGDPSAVSDYALRMTIKNRSRVDIAQEHPSVAEVLDFLEFSKESRPIIVDSFSVFPEVAPVLANLAKAFKSYSCRVDAPVFLLSHINKQGEIAGFKAIEHWVDGVFFLRKHKKNGATTEKRTLDVQKNRFGPNLSINLIMREGGFTLDVDQVIKNT